MEDHNSHRLSHFPPSFYGVTTATTADTTTKGVGDPQGSVGQRNGHPEHHRHRASQQQQQQQQQQIQGLGGRKVYGHQRCRIHPLPPAAAAPLPQPSAVGFHPPPPRQTQTHRPTTTGLPPPPPPPPPSEVAAAPGRLHGSSSFQLSPGKRVSYADAASGGATRVRGCGAEKAETAAPSPPVPRALDSTSSSSTVVASASDEPADPRASAGLFGSIGRRHSGGDGGGSSDPDIFLQQSLDEEKASSSDEAFVGGSSLVGNDRRRQPQDPQQKQPPGHPLHPSSPTAANGASFGSPIKMPPVGMSNGDASDDCSSHGLMSSPRASPSPRAPPQCGRRTGEHDRRPRIGVLDERHSSESSLVSSPRAGGKEEERDVDVHAEREEGGEGGGETDTSLQSIQPCRNLSGMFEEMYVVDAASSSDQRTPAAADKQPPPVDAEEGGKNGEIGQTAISPSGVAELGVPGEDSSSHPEGANANAKAQQLDASAGLSAPTDKDDAAGDSQNAKISEECGATPLASGGHGTASTAAAVPSTPSVPATAGGADVPIPVLRTPAPAKPSSSTRSWDDFSSSNADFRVPDFRLHADLKRDLPQPLVNRVSFYGVVHDINKEAACMAANDHSAFHVTGMAAAAAAAQAAFDAGQVPKEESRGPLVVAVNGPPPPDDDVEKDGVAPPPAAPPVGAEDRPLAPGSASTSAVIDEEIWLLSAIASRTAEEIESRGSAKCPPTFAEAMGEKEPAPTEAAAVGPPPPPVVEDGNAGTTNALGGQTANPLTALSASRTQLWKPSRSWWEAKSGKNPWIEPKSHNKRWRYLWPLIHYHKFLARCIKKLKRNGVDVKTSVSPVSVFLREEVCFVSDHLASVSKFTSEEWMSCLQHFHGWTDPDPAAQAALRESISRQKLRTLSEPNDVQSPLLRNQIDEQFLRAMAAQREQMVNGDKMMAGQSKGKSSAQIIHEAQRKQPREPRPPQHGAGGAGAAEYQQGPMMHHYPPHFSGSYGHMFAGNVPMGHGYPLPPQHGNPSQSPGGKQQRGGRRNKASQKGRRGQRGNRGGAANSNNVSWPPQHQYGAHPPYGMYQNPYGHAPTGQYMGYPGGGPGGPYYPPQTHHHSHQHHGGSHLSEFYPPHGHDGGGGYPMPSTYHSGQLLWPNGGAGLGPDMAGAAPTVPYSAPIVENAAYYGPPTPGTPAGPAVSASPHSLHHASSAHLGGMEVMHPSQPHPAENGSGAGDQTPASQQVPLSPFWGDPRQYLDQDMISQILATPQGKQHVPSSPHRKEATKGDGDGGPQRDENSEKHAAGNWNGGAKEASEGAVANANPLLINPYYQQPGAREGYVPPSPATQFMMGPPPSAYFQQQNQLYDSNGFGSPPPANKKKHHHLPVVPDETTDASTTNDGGTGNEAAAAAATASETPLAGDVTPPPPVRKITGNESPVPDC